MRINLILIILAILITLPVHSSDRSKAIERLAYQSDLNFWQKKKCRKQFEKVEEKDIAESTRFECDKYYLTLTQPVQKRTQAAYLAPCVVPDQIGGLPYARFCSQQSLNSLRELNFELGYSYDFSVTPKVSFALFDASQTDGPYEGEREVTEYIDKASIKRSAYHSNECHYLKFDSEIGTILKRDSYKFVDHKMVQQPFELAFLTQLMQDSIEGSKIQLSCKTKKLCSQIENGFTENTYPISIKLCYGKNQKEPIQIVSYVAPDPKVTTVAGEIVFGDISYKLKIMLSTAEAAQGGEAKFKTIQNQLTDLYKRCDGCRSQKADYVEYLFKSHADNVFGPQIKSLVFSKIDQ